MMSESHIISEESVAAQQSWSERKKFWAHTLFIFIALLCIPLDWGFYKMVYFIDYAHLNYRHMNEIVAFFNPQFINIFSESGFFGLASFINIPFVFLLGVIGSFIWGKLDKTTKDERRLYYWASVFARYRVAYGAIAWGYKKMFLMQMPPQYEGLWNTELLDFFAKRLYWEYISVSMPYEFFLGFAEFFAGFLLLFRRTTTVGALLAFIVFGNIAVSNLSYDIGEQVPSTIMAILAVFLIWKDIPAVFQLLIKQKDSAVEHYYPEFRKKWQKYSRWTLKYGFNFIFVILFFALEVVGFTTNDFYKIPNTAGLENSAGYYEVTEFRKNGELIPYNPLDTARWQNVTFEDWSSIGIKMTGKVRQISMFAAGSYPRTHEVYNGEWHFYIEGDSRRYGKYAEKKEKHDPENRDINIDWEFAGMSGRNWFYYKADTVEKVLYLQHKSRFHREEKMILKYERPKDGRIIFNGINEYQDSIYVVLDRSERDYVLFHTRADEVVWKP